MSERGKKVFAKKEHHAYRKARWWLCDALGLLCLLLPWKPARRIQLDVRKSWKKSHSVCHEAEIWVSLDLQGNFRKSWDVDNIIKCCHDNTRFKICLFYLSSLSDLCFQLHVTFSILAVSFVAGVSFCCPTGWIFYQHKKMQPSRLC